MIDSEIFENKTAAYFTLGCKLNFAETSAIGRQLSEQGVRKALPGEQADICIINTCSVTEWADKKCRQTIRRIFKQHPHAFIVVTGCYAQLKPEEIAQIPGVDLILGAEQKTDIIRHIKEASLKKKDGNQIAVSAIKDIRSFVPSCSGDDRTRYFLKVQDGCDYYCSFCTIPFARGRSRNGKIADLVPMAASAGLAGAKEVVLTGVNIGDFGKTTKETFFDLIQALDTVQPVERFRISSIEPNLLTDDILRFVAQADKFAPHFHIPLQAGSDEVLKLMRRKYDTGLFRSKIERIKELMPDAFIGVDVIVGVRGETDALFEETFSFLEKLPFSQLHVFTYSERTGTKALDIQPIIDPRTKQERSRRLLELSDEKWKAFYHSQYGKQKTVLFEQARKGNNMVGFTENYVRVEAPYDKSLINIPVSAVLKKLNEDNTALKADILNK